MKNLGLILGFTTVSLFVSAQKLEFDKMEHNFQQIKETNGEVKCIFLYENKSKIHVIVATVENNNRAIRIAAKNDTVRPKEKREIVVTLSPRDKLGNFEHTITVKTIEDGENYSYPLKIKANIEPRPREKEEIYGMMEGNIRYKTNFIRFDNLHPNSVVIDTFPVYNVWGDTMILSYGNMPACIEILSLSKKLAPQEEGKIIFKFSAAAKNDWGFVWDKFVINTNDTLRPGKTFNISGDIYDDFSSWTPEQTKNAPKASFGYTEYNFGTKIEGEEVSHDFILTNTGKSMLCIRKLKSSCGCTAVKPEKEELNPGESTVVKVIFKTRGKTGNQKSTIDVITNDPTQPKITLALIGHVTKAQ
jgi:hypothetical protein